MTAASPIPADEFAAIRDTALAAAVAGGEAALRHFRSSDLAIERKSDASPVTRADRESEAAVRAALTRACPDDAWLGEETGAAERLGGSGGRSSGRRWIVDPVDGTKNFVRGIPLWSTLVACEADGPVGPRIIAAAAVFPGIGEHYDAHLGGGARCNGRPIQVSRIARLDQALFAYYTYEMFRRHGMERVFQELSARTAVQRGGGDAWMHMLVASGRADCSVEPGLQPWDIAATSLIVTEAGGRCTDAEGRDSIRSGNAVLSNGLLHEEVLGVVSRLRERPASAG